MQRVNTHLAVLGMGLCVAGSSWARADASAPPEQPSSPPSVSAGDAPAATNSSPQSPQPTESTGANAPPANTPSPNGPPAETPPANTMEPVPVAAEGLAADVQTPPPARESDSAASVPDAPAAVASPTAAASPVPSPALPEGPAVPLRPLFQLGIAFTGTWLTQRSYDYFSDDDLHRALGATFSADVWSLAPRLELFVGVDASYATTSQSESRGYVIAGELDQTDLGGYVGLRAAVLDWLAPHVRVAGGASLIDAKLELRSDAVERDEVLGYATLGAGITFLSPSQRLSSTRRRFNSLGLAGQIEGGYAFARDLEWTLPSIAAGASQRVAVAPTPLGTLERGGPYLRLALLARF